MKTLLDHVGDVLHDGYVAPDQMVLREVNRDSYGMFTMESEIENREGTNYKLYRFEDPAVLFPYFKRGQDLRKMCDYILFAERDGEFYCLLIELKRGDESATKQLEAGEAFARFILDAANRVKKPLSANATEFRKIRVEDFKGKRGSLKAITPAYTNRYLNLQTRKFCLKYLLR